MPVPNDRTHRDNNSLVENDPEQDVVEPEVEIIPPIVNSKAASDARVERDKRAEGEMKPGDLRRREFAGDVPPPAAPRRRFTSADEAEEPPDAEDSEPDEEDAESATANGRAWSGVSVGPPPPASKTPPASGGSWAAPGHPPPKR